MRRFLISVLALSCMAFSVLAQSADSHISPFHLGLDLQTKYIWRGSRPPSSSRVSTMPGAGSMPMYSAAIPSTGSMRRWIWA